MVLRSDRYRSRHPRRGRGLTLVASGMTRRAWLFVQEDIAQASGSWAETSWAARQWPGEGTR